jgi:hypothetical protein
MEEENINLEKSNNKSSRKSITLKIFVDENESTLIKGKLNQFNESFKNNKFQKDKSMSEFLREIVLNSLLNLNNNSNNYSNNSQNNLEIKVDQSEQFTKRSISLIFEIMKENFGEDKAKKMLKKAKINIVALDEESEINGKNNDNK